MPEKSNAKANPIGSNEVLMTEDPDQKKRECNSQVHRLLDTRYSDSVNSGKSIDIGE